MVGQRLEAQAYHPMARMLDDDRIRRMLESLKGNITAAVAKMPTHREFLEKYCAVDEP